MFRRAPSYKPATKIRNSERKQLAADVQTTFYNAFSGKDEEQTKALLERLLPSSEIESCTFATSKGQKGTIYSSAAGAKNALFIRYESHLVPTLFSMWSCPSLTTTVLTGSQVLDNLQTGSDLMVKGMFEYSESVKAGEVVAIRVSDKEHVVAIGIAAVDFASIKREQGGKGLFLVTCLGDSLCPVEAYPAEDIPEVSPTMPEMDSLIMEDRTPHLQENADDETPDIDEVTALTTEQIDSAFEQALLYGLSAVASGEQKSFPLPMNSSTLMDTHVLPFLPSFHSDLQMKKTSWKKATKFISKQKFLKTKEQKGQLNITTISWDAEVIKNFVPYALPQVEKTIEPESAIESPKKSVVQVQDLYKTPSGLSAFFAASEWKDREKDYLTATDLRDLVISYATENKLVSQDNQKMIMLDPTLYHMLSITSTQKALSRDVLARAMAKKCSPYYSINGQKAKKGTPQQVSLSTEQRQGKKSVTKISHLEPYLSSTQVDDLMAILKRKCAGSVSLGEVKGTKPGTTVEVTVQGSKIEECQEILEDPYGIPRHLITIEAAKKKK